MSSQWGHGAKDKAKAKARPPGPLIHREPEPQSRGNPRCDRAIIGWRSSKSRGGQQWEHSVFLESHPTIAPSPKRGKRWIIRSNRSWQFNSRNTKDVACLPTQEDIFRDTVYLAIDCWFQSISHYQRLSSQSSRLRHSMRIHPFN